MIFSKENQKKTVSENPNCGFNLTVPSNKNSLNSSRIEIPSEAHCPKGKKPHFRINFSFYFTFLIEHQESLKEFNLKLNIFFFLLDISPLKLDRRVTKELKNSIQ